jgi:hypothetical protein
MKDTISTNDWLNWVDTGEATDMLLLQLALKIKTGHNLGEREASIYVFHAAEIEKLLKEI